MPNQLCIYGGRTEKGTEAKDNKVYLAGGTVSGNIYGGYNGSGSVAKFLEFSVKPITHIITA